MKIIDERKINQILLDSKKVTGSSVEKILEKSLRLQRLTLEETAVLLSVDDSECISRIFTAASIVKDRIYGRRVVIFAPLYIDNNCLNNCRYCAFRADNSLIRRKTLNIDEIKLQVERLLEKGHKRILMVAGESSGCEDDTVDYYVNAIKAVYDVKVGQDKIRRVNINCAPLSIDGFRKLKKAGIGTYQLFQETYHNETYRYVHPNGPKSDPDNRLDAINKAFKAGIDDVGIGVLFGLYDFKFDTLAMLMHIEYLERIFGIGPHTISVPRIEPAVGADFVRNLQFKVSDEEFKRIVAVLRLSVPYTGIILSTRETAKMRDELFNFGVSQISAESKTSPGGYISEGFSECSGEQFSLSDNRTLDEVIGSLIDKGFIPSFCAACYRKERTGEAFMNLAKPGTIKGKCNLNALITFKEYLDDFASNDVKRKGYKLIEDTIQTLDNKTKDQLFQFFSDIRQGIRDEYV
ncbi:MAG: [FeFe] hydrogenase H-cluster radical SAM maturase HydG [bacterium]